MCISWPENVTLVAVALETMCVCAVQIAQCACACNNRNKCRLEISFESAARQMRQRVCLVCGASSYRTAYMNMTMTILLRGNGIELAVVYHRLCHHRPRDVDVIQLQHGFSPVCIHFMIITRYVKQICVMWAQDDENVFLQLHAATYAFRASSSATSMVCVRSRMGYRMRKYGCAKGFHDNALATECVRYGDDSACWRHTVCHSWPSNSRLLNAE